MATMPPTSPDTDAIVGYTIHVDGQSAAELATLEELAAATIAVAASESGYHTRARTAAGERQLTRDEHLELLVEMERQINAERS